MTIRFVAGLAVPLFLGVPACSRSSAPAGPPPVVIDEASRKEAEEIFANRCTPCHGPEGAGNGPASATLNPKPRNFQDRAWQTSVKQDLSKHKVLVDYYARVGERPAVKAALEAEAAPAT